MFDHNDQAITHFEGLVEIQTNYYLAMDKHDNMTLESHEDTTSGHSS
jgi:hypothetical protein